MEGRRASAQLTFARDRSFTNSVVRCVLHARAVNRIKHPSIVQVSDYAQLPDCTAYIVMEFLKGESLASRVHQGPLPCSSALHIAWQIAEALSAAHAKGKTWKLEQTRVRNNLYGVWGVDANTVYAVGQDGIILRSR